jgi:hypothetical protein
MLDIFIIELTELVTQYEYYQYSTLDLDLMNWTDFAMYYTNNEMKIIKARNLYSVYKLWCRENKRDIESETSFGRKMKLYFNNKKTRMGTKYQLRY